MVQFILGGNMIQSTLGHLQVNISVKNIAFYKDFLTVLGWKTLLEEPNMLGIEDKNHASLWFTEPLKQVVNDYDGKGTNHYGFMVPSQKEVDDTVDYLKKNGIPALFETPRHRPEFSGKDDTYYQVMFETPDKLLFEVVYIGPK